MTQTAKVTAAQRRTLQQIADHDVYSGMDGTPYYQVDTDPDEFDFVNLRWAVVARLTDAGLVKSRTPTVAEGYRATVRDRVYRLTDSGRAVLAGQRTATL